VNTLFNLLLSADTTTETPTSGFSQWIVPIMLLLLMVFFVVTQITGRKRQKKEEEKQRQHFKVGATVTTIGGIIGKVVEIDSNGDFVIETGTGNNKTTIKFNKQSLYKVDSGEPAPKATENEVDEIK
jgi:preprotein translocase YajC subunit